MSPNQFTHVCTDVPGPEIRDVHKAHAIFRMKTDHKTTPGNLVRGELHTALLANPLNF